MRMLKNLEKTCNRRAMFTIIQDWERANALIAENNISSSSIVVVPNGPLGPPCVAKSDYFQRKFGLSPSCRIVLHIGMISPSVLSLELAQVAGGWSDDWVMVYHEREKRSNCDPYIKQIREVGQGRVLLSLDPVPYDELDNVVCSAHIGVVFYQKALGPNFALMAGASGKLGHYLRCGLPVICLNLPGFGEMIHKYQCGVCVNSIEQVTEAIHTICQNYDCFRSNAIRCYEEVYEFSNHFQQVLCKIQSLSQQGREIVL